MTDTLMNGHEEPTSLMVEKKSESCSVTDLPIDKVTVYKDKAEVVKYLKLEVLPTQQIEICFEQLPSSIDPNSIRVDVANKAASILDVTYNCKPLNQANNQTERLQQINKELHELELDLESLEAKKARYLKQKSVLDCFTDTLVEKLNEDGIQEEKEEEIPEVTPVTPQKLSKADKKQSKLDLAVPPPKPVTVKSEAKMNPYDPSHLETVSNFFQLYDERGEKFDKEIQASIQDISEAEAKKDALEAEKVEIALRIDELLYRELLVIIEGITQSEEAIVTLTYVVKNCTWTSNYDIRVSNQTGVMQICYYATIRQMSHEDWYHPRSFAVSTMEPGLGGTVPDLAVQRVRFKHQLTQFFDQLCDTGSPVTSPSAQSNGSTSSPMSPPTQPGIMASPSIRRGGNSTSFRSSSFRKSKSTSMDFLSLNSIPETVKTTNMSMHSFSFEDGTNRGVSISKTNSTTAMATGIHSGASTLTKQHKSAIKSVNKTAESGHHKSSETNVSGDSVQYEIPRPPLMVMCDNKECKIMIGQYSFEPSYNYVTVPRLSPYAYQRAFTTNKSGVTFLAGSANIFIDGCFIGKTFIKDIHPSEEFICNLGVDKGISIRYEPLIKIKDNHSKNLCVTYRQVIQMTNRNAKPAKVTLTERIPVATEEEKIKIKLLEPSLKADKGKSIRKNDLGQIDWDHEIAPGATKEAVIKFVIEHPIEREVVISNLA